MFSEMFQKLWSNGIIQIGIWETVYMTLISTAVAYLIGLPLGIILNVTDKGGIHPIGWLNKLLGVIVNIFRSIPFIILMVAMLPVAKISPSVNVCRMSLFGAIVTLICHPLLQVFTALPGKPVISLDPNPIRTSK